MGGPDVKSKRSQRIIITFSCHMSYVICTTHVAIGIKSVRPLQTLCNACIIMSRQRAYKVNKPSKCHQHVDPLVTNKGRFTSPIGFGHHFMVDNVSIAKT